MGFMEIIMNEIKAATKINSLTRGYLARKTIKQNLEAPSDLPESIITNILSFCPMPDITINKAISTDLLRIYKETITKRLDVTEEIVNALKNSEIIDLFNKLNDESTKAALTMGFSLKQIATIPSDQMSEYKTQFDAYDIPDYIQNQIDNLSENNGRLNLYDKRLTTGQLCKILNTLTTPQRNALTLLNLARNELRSLPESIGNLTALTSLHLARNQLISLPDSFGNLIALTYLYLETNQLRSLPDSFENLTALIKLHLDSNKLTSLPESIGNLSALTRLDLTGNQLKLLPESFGNLSALTLLYLTSNQLRSLPVSFGNLTALTSLHLARNHLISLPDSFGNLIALTSLILVNNKLNDSQKYVIKRRFNRAVL